MNPQAAQGYVKTWKVEAHDAGKRLDVFLAERFPRLSRTQLQHLITAGRSTLDDLVRKPHTKVRLGQIVRLAISAARKIELVPEDIPLAILYEDEDILVINKQPGLVVHPAPGHLEHTLVHAILHHCRDLAATGDPSRPGIVHRLDKDTSGCLLIAKREEGLRKLHGQFERRKVMKQYLSLVFGRMEAFKGELELAIGRHPVDRKRMAVSLTGKHAHTTFEVVERFERASLVRVFLRTGRTHQIRVHMSYVGHPVLGDTSYGKRGSELAETLGISRQMLHAAVLGVVHPRTNQWMLFTAPLPQDMENAVEKLRMR